MLERVLLAVAAGGVDERVVVLGAHAGDILAAVDLHGARAVVCEAWRDGQAASLHAGLGALPEASDRALVVLGDGPALDPAAVARMAAAPSGPRALAADYGGGRSHPVVVPRPLWDQIPRARRDAGQAAGRGPRRLPRPARAGRCRLRDVVLTAAAQPQPVDEPGRHRVAGADSPSRPRAGAARRCTGRCSSRTRAGARRSRDTSASVRARSRYGWMRCSAPWQGSTLIAAPSCSAELGEPLLQEAPAAVEPRHDRPDRDPEDLGGVGIAELADVHQHDHLAEVLGQLPSASTTPLPDRRARTRSCGSRPVSARRL